jgi:hypothetical protein
MENDLGDRCNAIEECYEFMLAYAAQGLPSDQGSQSGGQLREFLGRAVEAVSGLAGAYTAAVKQERLHPAERYQAFLAVLDRDASDSLAAIGLVLAQPAISSQLIDNLNASIHLRALLTDLFLIDEIFKLQRNRGKLASTS